MLGCGSSEPTVRTRRWSRAEYERLIELGVFHEDEPIELLDGELVVREPKGSRHETAVGLVEDALRRAFGPGWLVRVGAPLALDDVSEPEPDVSVVRGARRDYRDPGPDPVEPMRRGYRQLLRLEPPAVVSPLDASASPVSVADLLP